MPITRRMFFRKAVGVAGVVAGGCVLLPNYAYAGGCASETRILGFGAFEHDGISTYSLQIDDWILGDCELRNTLISFDRDRGLFKGEVCTHFTHHKDVWHLQLKLRTGSPNLPKTQRPMLDKTFDGPQMSEKDIPLFHPWEERFTFDPSINLGTLFAEATSCC